MFSCGMAGLLGSGYFIWELVRAESFRKNIVELVQMGLIAPQISRVSVMPVKAEVGQEPRRGDTMRTQQASERPVQVLLLAQQKPEGCH